MINVYNNKIIMDCTLQKSEHPGWWVLTDRASMTVIRFQEHRFNETQKVSFLEEEKLNPMAVPRIMREMGEWLYKNHKEVAL